MVYTRNEKWCIDCYDEESQWMEINMEIGINVNNGEYLNISKMEENPGTYLGKVK